MSTKIKLCGLKSLDDIKIVNRLKPEFVGFVMYEKSHRNVTKDTLKLLKEALDKDIKAVGVFVDKDIDEVAELISEGLIDVAQLHGSEDNKYIDTLRSKLDYHVTIIKAFKTDEDSIINAKISHADYVLFDPGKGDGMTFAWEVIKDFEKPYFLAGGLTPQNVKEAIEVLNPYAVDVSSGIETDKKKDATKAEQFVKAVRE